MESRACFFEFSSAGRHGAIFAASKCGNREIVANLFEHRFCNFREVLRSRAAFDDFVFSVSPGSRIVNFMEFFDTSINSAVVHVNDFLAFLAIALDDGVFQVFNSVIDRNDLSECEECSLHDHVDTSAEAESPADSVTVQGVEFNMVLSDSAFDASRKFFFQFFVGPGAVQHECAAFFDTAEDVKAFYIGLTMASDVVSCVDEVRHIDRASTETQVRNSYAAGFLGVISEVCLSIHVGVVTDDLDSGFVSADSTIRTEAPEFAGRKASRVNRHFRFARKAEVGNVVVDSQREAVERMFFLEFFEDSEEVFRKNVFGAHTCTAADNVDVEVFFSYEANDIEVERFAEGARFFRTVDDSDLLNSLRKNVEEVFVGERTIEVNVDGTDFFALALQVFDSLFSDVGERTHGNDNVFSIRSTEVVERFVRTASDFRNLVHVVSYDIRHSVVEFVGSFCVLEVYVRVFCSAADFRMIRVEGTFAECFDSVPVNEFLEVFEVHDFNFLNFVRCTETIEEVDERQGTFNCCQMSDTTEIHDFLNIGFGQETAACCTSRHNVLMVTEDVQCMVSQSTSSYVEYAREEFTGNFVHVRDHEEEALRCRVRSCQSTSL